MNKEIQSIIAELKDTLEGTPWFGQPVYHLLEQVNPGLVYKVPANGAHSLADLLYHMITWAEFTLDRINGNKDYNEAETEAIDWRPIDPKKHTWAKGLEEYKSINTRIIQALANKNDELLNQTVDFRKYNFQHLLKGYIQHNIYHIGQIAYLKKLLE